MSAPLTEPNPRPPTARSLKANLRGWLFRLVLSLALGALFAWLVARGGVPLLPPAEAFRRVAWWAVPLYALCVLVTHFFRASRWRFLIAPVRELRLREVIALNWIGFFAIFAFPLRLGEFARPAVSKLRHGIPISAGVGTVAVERVLDGLITSLCVAWALFVVPRRSTDDYLARHLPLYGGLALALFVAAFCALGLFLWQRNVAIRITEAIVGRFSSRLAPWVAQKVDSLADGLHSLAAPRLVQGFILESAAYWGFNIFGAWLLGQGVGLAMSFGQAVSITGILAIGILLPTGPGLFGSFQLAVSTALKLYFIEEVVATTGSVYVFLLYGVQSVIIVITGVWPLYRLHIPLSRLLPLGSYSQSPS